MLQGKAVDKLKESSQWASKFVTQYFYRKTFGLTYKEYLEEDAEAFIANSMIMDIIRQIESRELKKAERKGKMK